MLPNPSSSRKFKPMSTRESRMYTMLLAPALSWSAPARAAWTSDHVCADLADACDTFGNRFPNPTTSPWSELLSIHRGLPALPLLYAWFSFSRNRRHTALQSHLVSMMPRRAAEAFLHALTDKGSRSLFCHLACVTLQIHGITKPTAHYISIMCWLRNARISTAATFRLTIHHLMI